MYMNFSDFRKLLGADPWNRDPETLRARHSDPEFEREAMAAEVFERKLQATLDVAVDDRLADELLALVETPVVRHNPPRWLALAASVVLVAGVTAVLWQQFSQPRDVHVYVAHHLAHDGADLLADLARSVDSQDTQRTLAQFGVMAEPQLAERVRLIKFCPTPNGKGAHMVIEGADGPVHLIYMPETPVTDGEEFGFDGLLTHLVRLDKGSAALIGGSRDQLAGLDRLVRESIQPLPTRT
jgi:hypothetical protein